MSIVSKHPVLVSFFIIPVSLVVALLLVAVQVTFHNSLGVCRADGRVLTDEELIRRVILEINNRETIRITLPNGEFANLPYVKYVDAEEFLTQNPSCCTVRSLSSPMSNISWFDRYTGAAYKVIHLTYKARYLDEGGRESIMPISGEHGTFVISSCGHIWG
jgi:hypothetical protein